MFIHCVNCNGTLVCWFDYHVVIFERLLQIVWYLMNEHIKRKISEAVSIALAEERSKTVDNSKPMDILLSWKKEFGIEYWPDEPRWELRIWNKNDKGELDGVKWDYEGNTLEACVKLHAKYEVQ